MCPARLSAGPDCRDREPEEIENEASTLKKAGSDEGEKTLRRERIRSSEEGHYVPSMHRKHSSDGCWSRIGRRGSGGVHRPRQKILQSKRS